MERCASVRWLLSTGACTLSLLEGPWSCSAWAFSPTIEECGGGGRRQRFVGGEGYRERFAACFDGAVGILLGHGLNVSPATWVAGISYRAELVVASKAAVPINAFVRRAP